MRNALRVAFFVLLSCVGFLPAPAEAAITSQIVWSSAPNFFGSPSWGPYVTSATTSLRLGTGNIGERSTDPTAYEILNGFEPGDIMVTSFNSWRGTANPPAPFSSELGNRLHAGLFINGNGQQFRLSNLSYNMTSTDGALNFIGSFGSGDSYSLTRVGILAGTDTLVGTPDDVLVTSGSATTLVDGLAYVGVGNGYWPADASEMATTASQIARGLSVSMTYTLRGDTGQTISEVESSISNVPEPSAFLLMSAGLAGLWAKRRRS